MATLFPVTLRTPEDTLFTDDIISVYVPAYAGDMEVLAGHAEMIVLLASGLVIMRVSGSKKRAFYISGGVLDIHSERVTLACEEALALDTIDDKSLESAIMELETRKNHQAEVEARALQVADAQAIRAKVEIIRRLKSNKKT